MPEKNSRGSRFSTKKEFSSSPNGKSNGTSAFKSFNVYA